MLQKLTGIVLRARNYGESNQILLVYSKTHGKLSMMARGSKKTKSRFGAVTEPLTEAEFVCFFGNGMATLSQADILRSHHLLRTNLILTTYAAYWFELMDRLLAENDPFPPLYNLLSHALSLLEEDTHPEILTRIFELHVMKIAGYQPVLHQCLKCQATHDPFHFSVIHGGLLCTNCIHVDQQAMPITSAVSHLLPLLQKIDIHRLGEIRIRSETEQQLKDVIHQFMDHHIGVTYKSRSIIERLKADL